MMEKKRFQLPQVEPIVKNTRKQAVEGDLILWKKENLQMVVTIVRENSVIAEHLTFPVKDREQDFDFPNTVINHKNYQVLQR